MKPIDILIILVIAVIIGVAIAYIVRAKKKGAKCIGCPAGDCSSARKHEDPSGTESNGCSCGCGSKQ